MEDECALKQIGITQTFEGCFLGNLSEVVIIVVLCAIIIVLCAVILCVVNFYMFIIVASVGLVWKDLAAADNAGFRWPQLSPGLGMYFLSSHQCCHISAVKENTCSNWWNVDDFSEGLESGYKGGVNRITVSRKWCQITNAALNAVAT